MQDLSTLVNKLLHEVGIHPNSNELNYIVDGLATALSTTESAEEPKEDTQVTGE